MKAQDDATKLMIMIDDFGGFCLLYICFRDLMNVNFYHECFSVLLLYIFVVSHRESS